MAAEPTYAEILEAARSKVDEAGQRFANAPCPFRATWWPEEVSFQEDILSDYGIANDDDEDLRAEFLEEVRAIRESLEEMGHQVALAPWQQSGNKDGEAMMEGVNRHAEALALWDELCLPLRRRGDVVFRLRSPSDAMGTPILQSMALDDFLKAVSIHTASAAMEKSSISRKRDNWRTAAWTLGSILVLVVLV